METQNGTLSYPEADPARDALAEAEIQALADVVEATDMSNDEAYRQIFAILLKHRASLELLAKHTLWYVPQHRMFGHSHLPWVRELMAAKFPREALRGMVASHALTPNPDDANGDRMGVHQRAILNDQDTWDAFDTVDSFQALMIGIAKHQPNQILALRDDLAYHLGRIRCQGMPKATLTSPGIPTDNEQRRRFFVRRGLTDANMIAAKAVDELTRVDSEQCFESIRTLSVPCQIVAAIRVNADALGCVLKGYVLSNTYNLSRADFEWIMRSVCLPFYDKPKLGSTIYRWLLEGAKRAGDTAVFSLSAGSYLKGQLELHGWQFARLTARQNPRTFERELQVQVPPTNGSTHKVILSASRHTHEVMKEGDEVMFHKSYTETQPVHRGPTITIYGHVFHPIAPPSYQMKQRAWEDFRA